MNKLKTQEQLNIYFPNVLSSLINEYAKLSKFKPGQITKYFQVERKTAKSLFVRYTLAGDAQRTKLFFDKEGNEYAKYNKRIVKPVNVFEDTVKSLVNVSGYGFSGENEFILFDNNKYYIQITPEKPNYDRYISINKSQGAFSISTYFANPNNDIQLAEAIKEGLNNLDNHEASFNSTFPEKITTAKNDIRKHYVTKGY